MEYPQLARFVIDALIEKPAKDKTNKTIVSK